MSGELTKDAGDEEIERMELEIAHWIDNEAKCVSERDACREARDELQKLADIAKARGARIKELEEEMNWLLTQFLPLKPVFERIKELTAKREGE